ncbi:hypothetical protein [Alkalilimnicola sp. S0819]|uniref:hypothetical protein n=1 Tax=Alkalilimnicola sp. S0819 TaxID=2613922 RepID=UPI0012627BEC|nr:hypothetical protein [Alkalilimnicola sp. S0819]KAB7622675.1 hypothetical protein F3N43_11775 [Alkalilimnicola sp. S0819]MPQ17312.1 hypothetical protein [Alkalilimnicola sp. S0819]
MSVASREIRKQAKAWFSNNEVGPDEQTRICLFLQAVKGINAAILAKVELQPLDWMPYKYLHNQYFKEIELSTLLGKATSWSTNPFVYMDATNLSLSVWQETDASRYLTGFFELNADFYRYLALSHAFMSDMRLLPLLPAALPLETPFLSALRDIEEENGRQIQTQIRLLKGVDVGLEHAEKERIINEQRIIVDALFDRLLTTLCSLEQSVASY